MKTKAFEHSFVFPRYIYPTVGNWTFLRFARAAQKKGCNGTNKNMTLARIRTKVPGFSSADAITTKPRVPVEGLISRRVSIFTILQKKPTDSHSYLLYISCHPVHIKNSIIYSQFLRYKRICTRNTDFIDHSKKLTTHLLHKAYPVKVITKQWNKVTKIPRT